jgi:hypothetical protein
MECAANDIACVLKEVWKTASSHEAREIAWQLLKDFAALVGVALTGLKWWEKREPVIFGRIKTLLGDQGLKTRSACKFVIQTITRPGPADRPEFPVFAERTLRRLFQRRHWKPVFSLAGPLTSAERQLRSVHKSLEKRQAAATDYQTFINEQKFAAHILDGAIASGRTESKSYANDIKTLNGRALESFEKALKVPGKASDFDALELKGLHLRKLGIDDPEKLSAAEEVFGLLSQAAKLHRDSLDAHKLEERREITFIMARAARHRAEILHGRSAATGTGRDILEGVEPLLNDGGQISGRMLLDRARFYEIDSCIRITLHGLGPITNARINNGLRAYQELQRQSDPRNLSWPSRIVQYLALTIRNDGQKAMLREASDGIARMNKIQANGGCAICQTSRLVKIAPAPNPMLVPSYLGSANS